MVKFLFLLIQFALICTTSSTNVLHLPLHRRGGRFAPHQPANLSYLAHLLERVETRYSRTYRDVESNRLVRRWSQIEDERAMLDEAGQIGTWYTILSIGSPPQPLEADIDLLSPDFYTILTTSGDGSKFNTFASQSHDPGTAFVHPLCRLASDQINFPKHMPLRLEWPICKPSKSSRHTLANSGTILGLAPNSRTHGSSLSQLTSPSLVHTLVRHDSVASQIWSITLLDSTAGVLSIGGTLAAEFEEAKAMVDAELKYIGQDDAKLKVEEEVRGKMAFAMPDGSNVEDHFKWVDVSGASGWWTGLMSGIWVDGIKILKNQPFLVDLTCPFIIAPPTAFDTLYGSISGSMPLSSYLNTSLNAPNNEQNTHPHKPRINVSETFHLFPCLSPPSISFELGGWPFPLASPSRLTRDDALHGPAGGAFSLGKVEEHFSALQNNATINSGDSENQSHKTDQANYSVNSGFCVGVIVRSDMGERDEKRWRDSGMRNTWVLGEPFFRGLGVVFDEGNGDGGKARIGFRSF